MSEKINIFARHSGSGAKYDTQMENKQELTIKEKQEIILEIMKDIDRFCRANNIPYSLSSGTLLGAVRHGGFIPWDDDADMFMLREDFDRFVKIYKSHKYHLLFNDREGNDFLANGFVKISDPSTAAESRTRKENFGVFIDIFPLDPVPDDPKLRKEFMHSVMSLDNRIHHRQKSDIVSIIKSYRHPLKWWMNKMNDTLRNNPYKDSDLVAHIVGSTNYRTVLNKDRFDSLKDIDFEGYPFMAFSDTHSYLEMVFGADYMTPKKWTHSYKVYSK